jgi:hypothetical protein
MWRWLILLLLVTSGSALAHHVIGRPSYNLNEDSNTPPSIQMETQIGDYFVTYMVFPAFPRPNEPARINLYASRIRDDKPFQGKVRFTIRDDSWFGGNEEPIGTQDVDYNVFRQNFIVKKAGNYIVTAKFEADGQPYVIDFPLRIGNPAPVGTIGILVGVVILVLVGLNLVHRRRRLVNIRIRDAHLDERQR